MLTSPCAEKILNSLCVGIEAEIAAPAVRGVFFGMWRQIDQIVTWHVTHSLQRPLAHDRDSTEAHRQRHWTFLCSCVTDLLDTGEDLSRVA